MKLREYQEKAVTEVVAAVQKYDGTLLVGACGSGKTVMLVEVVRRIGVDSRWLYVVPRIELAEQAARHLHAAGIEPGFIAGNYEPNTDARAQIGTVQAIIHRRDAKSPDFIVLDEAHHYEADEWAITRRLFPNARVIGATATAERFDGRPLGMTFEHMVLGGTYAELIPEHLVRARLYAPRVRPLGLAMDPVDAVAHGLGSGKRAIVTVTRVDEARALAERISASLNVTAECIDGETPRSIRRSALDAFRAGRSQVLTNVYVLTEGLDVPEIDTLVLARRFDALGGYVQTVGRGFRRAPGKKDFACYDLVGASRTHGPPGTDIDWNLWTRPLAGRIGTGRGKGDGEPGAYSDELPISGEGLVRVTHGALEPGDPDPEPLRPVEKFSAIKQAQLRRAQAQAREIARRKSSREAREFLLEKTMKITRQFHRSQSTL